MKTITRFGIFATFAAGLFWLGACKNAGRDVAQRYTQAEYIRVNNTTHPSYDSRVIGDVFFSSYINGTNAYRYTSDPPFNVNIGAYSLTPNSVSVTILSAQVQINNQPKVNILNDFLNTSMDTRVDLDPKTCDGCGHFGSKWLKTDHFLQAIPKNDDTVTFFIRVRVGDEDTGEVRDLKFDFLPEVKISKFFKGLSV